jgi:hypothetical protein
VMNDHAEHMKKMIADMTAKVGAAAGPQRRKTRYNPATYQRKTIRIGLKYKRCDQRRRFRLLMYLMRILRTFNGPLFIGRD